MPASMTGFGRGVVRRKGLRYVVEIRSVNNRYCDVRVHSQGGYLELEHRLAALIKERCERGKFDVDIKLQREAPAKGEGTEEAAIIARWNRLEKIRKRLKLASPTSLETAVRWNPLEQSDRPELEEASREFLRAAEAALKNLETFRRQEGKALVADMMKRVKIIVNAVTRVEARASIRLPERMNELRSRIHDLAKDHGVHEGRVETELALLSDRADVTEEIVRLKNHLLKLEQTLRQEGAIGRGLDFLLQEINREVNTVGSKAADPAISNDVVKAKVELEKIREQAQNLE